MLESLLSALHPGLAPGAVAALLALSLLGTFISAAFGAGGGALLLLGMTLWLPAAVAVPVHGCIQLGANVGRAGVTLPHVRWPMVAAFAGGAALGAAAGSQVLVGLPGGWLEVILGGFLLYSLWGRLPVPARGSPGVVASVGAVTTALTLFVGATGPVVAAYLRALALHRLHYLGTFSACMTLQHGLKMVAFVWAGFAFGDYLAFIAAMIGVGFLGTLLGRAVITRLPEALFRRILRLLLTVLSLRLLASGLLALA